MRRFGLLLALVFVVVPAAQAQDSSQFDSNGVEINYVDQGTGEPVVLLHGLSQNLGLWATSGVAESLVESGYRVIAMDMRGHGDSGKPHSAEDYGLEMVRDVVRLLDHLGFDRAHLVGYSMGGFVTNKFRDAYPERIVSATLGGSGWYGAGAGGPLIDPDDLADSVADGDIGPLLRALVVTGDPMPTAEELANINQAVFAANDQIALAASVRGLDPVMAFTDDELAANQVPTLALIGNRDAMIRDVRALAGVMSNLEVVEIPGATHLTAPGDELFASSLLIFLAKHDSN